MSKVHPTLLLLVNVSKPTIPTCQLLQWWCNCCYLRLFLLPLPHSHHPET